MTEPQPILDEQERPLPAALDLDALEREGEPVAPFPFIANGHRFLMSDPTEVDWQDLIAGMSNPYMFFRLVLPPEDHERFFAAKLPGWKINRLMRDYNRHYGLPDLPNVGGLPR